MNFAQELMDAAAPVWQKYLTHPFITGMIDGNLDKKKFAFYLMQDCLYLRDYAKVYATAFMKTSDIHLMRAIYRDMQVIVSDESMTHIRYLKDMGYSEDDAYASALAPENKEYVNYMLRVAREGSVQEGLISVMACTFSYYYIALYARNAAIEKGTYENNYFAAWMDDYVGAIYKGIYDRTAVMCNEITQGLSKESKARLKEIFIRASEYELDFWNMAMRGPKA